MSANAGAPSAPAAAAPATNAPAEAPASSPQADADIDRALARRTSERRPAQPQREQPREQRQTAATSSESEQQVLENAEARAAEARRLRKIKIEGEEQDYDLDNEEQVLKDVQMGRVATKRMQEAAKIKRIAEQLVSGLRGENPLEFLRQVAPKLGIDPAKLRAASEQLLAKELEDEMMSPEEKAQRDKDAELERFRKREADAKKRKSEAEFEKLKMNAEENYTRKFTEALEQGGLPKTPYTLQRMAQLQLLANKHKIDISPAELARRVREDYVAEQKALFGSLDDEKFLDFLGEDLAAKARNAEIKRHRARDESGKFVPQQRTQPAPASAKDTKPTKQVMDREAFMRDLKRGA